jgi:hypothetical protein
MKYIKTFEGLDYYGILQLSIKLLKFSANSSSLQKMRELIEEGADVNYNDINDGTPLMRASTSMFYSGIKLLIEKGADINIKNRNGDTAFLRMLHLPLSTIMKNENVIKKIIDLLIINGVNLSEKNKFGNDVFSYFDLLKSTNLRKYIKDKFPEQYEYYLMEKNQKNIIYEMIKKFKIFETERYISDEDIEAGYDNYKITDFSVDRLWDDGGASGWITIEFEDEDAETKVDHWIKYDSGPTIAFDNWYPSEMGAKLRKYIEKGIKKERLNQTSNKYNL